MAKENIKIEYIELLKNVKAFPDNSPAKKRAKEKLGIFMRYVRDTYGQEMVDEISNKHT